MFLFCFLKGVWLGWHTIMYDFITRMISSLCFLNRVPLPLLMVYSTRRGTGTTVMVVTGASTVRGAADSDLQVWIHLFTDLSVGGGFSSLSPRQTQTHALEYHISIPCGSKAVFGRVPFNTERLFCLCRRLSDYWSASTTWHSWEMLRLWRWFLWPQYQSRHFLHW